MPCEYLDNLEFKKREFIQNEQQYFNQGDITYLLMIDNRYVGYLTIGKSKIENYLTYGEIKSLYLLNEYQGYGLGKILFNLGINKLKEMGYKDICLGCLSDNIKANNFYKYMGLNLIDSHETVTGNQKMIENIYVY